MSDDNRHPLGDERIPLCQRCQDNQGVKRLVTLGGVLVCRDCWEDYVTGKWPEPSQEPRP